MFVLVEYNDFYEKNIKNIKKHNFIPITLFKISLNGKNQIKEQLLQIEIQKKTLKPQYSAIQVTIERLENSTIGTINNLKNYFDLVIGLGGLNKINRFFIEDTQIDLIQDPHNSLFKTKMDFIHHFNSGLNQVLCKIAKEKEIGLFISLNFTQVIKKNFAKEFGRINQNLKFARKYNIPIYLNYIIRDSNQLKTPFELKSIMSLFDLSLSQKTNSINLLEQKIKENNFKKSEKAICDGIEII